MTEEIIKCVKGESCIHCGSTYCRFVDEVNELKQENKELKEWKERVVKLFESACRCKYLNEESDICSYTNKKCININKCVYKYQELSDIYRSALEEIKEMTKKYDAEVGDTIIANPIQDCYDIYCKINEVLDKG